jgi:hypothetical protein
LGFYDTVYDNENREIKSGKLYYVYFDETPNTYKYFSMNTKDEGINYLYDICMCYLDGNGNINKVDHYWNRELSVEEKFEIIEKCYKYYEENAQDYDYNSIYDGFGILEDINKYNSMYTD